MHGFTQFLEMHWEDIYPEEFKEFRKEWGKISRTTDGLDYFVQFSNHKSDPLERTGYKSPNHHDMVGDYAYPLKYVISHPADIWYGRTAKWMRVLKNKSRSKLAINYLDESHAKWLLSKMGIYDFDFAKKQLPKEQRRLSTVAGKAFLLAIQTDFTATPSVEGRKTVYPSRSSEMQARLFLKAGIDAIQDYGRNQKSAVVNDREPEQIIFLHRSAFEVVKVYSLHKDNKHSLLWIDPQDKHQRKLVSLLLQAMDGDKIVSGPEDGYFWTQKGRRIHVEFRNVKGTRDRKLGEKKHKEFGLHDHFATTITIDHSERGKISGTYSSDEKFKDIIDSMVMRWNHAKESEYRPDTHQEYKTRKEQQKQAYMRQEIEKKQKEAQEYEKSLVPTLTELASRLGLIFRPMPNRDYLYSNILQAITTAIRRKADRGNRDLSAFWAGQAEHYKEIRAAELDDKTAFEFGYFPLNLSNSLHPDLAQLKELVNAVNKITPADGMYAFSIALRMLKEKDQSP